MVWNARSLCTGLVLPRVPGHVVPMAIGELPLSKVTGRALRARLGGERAHEAEATKGGGWAAIGFRGGHDPTPYLP